MTSSHWFIFRCSSFTNRSSKYVSICFASIGFGTNIWNVWYIQLKRERYKLCQRSEAEFTASFPARCLICSSLPRVMTGLYINATICFNALFWGVEYFSNVNSYANTGWICSNEILCCCYSYRGTIKTNTKLSNDKLFSIEHFILSNLRDAARVSALS